MWYRIPLGVRFMLGSALAFSVMSALVKYAGTRLPTQEIVFARSVVALVLSLALLRRAGVLARDAALAAAARGLWGYGALSCVFYAMTHLPLAEATMIQYLHPTSHRELAAVVLGERGDRSLAASVRWAPPGVLLVVRPALPVRRAALALDPVAVGAALGGAVLTAVAYVGVRELSRTEHPLMIVLWFPLVAVPASLPGDPRPRRVAARLRVGRCSPASACWPRSGRCG